MAHELAHAAVLYLLGIQCDIEFGPEWTGTSQFDASSDGAWAAVTPRKRSPETPLNDAVERLGPKFYYAQFRKFR